VGVFLRQREDEVQVSDEVRTLAEQSLAFVQRFANQADLAMLEIAQSAVDNAGGTRRRARSKVVLLNQQDALAGLRALARNGDAIDAAADHDYVEMLPV
jgi:hypothetical protein